MVTQYQQAIAELENVYNQRKELQTAVAQLKAERERLYAEANKAIEEAKTAIQKRDRELANRKLAIELRDQKIAQLDQLIQKRNQEIASARTSNCQTGISPQRIRKTTGFSRTGSSKAGKILPVIPGLAFG